MKGKKIFNVLVTSIFVITLMAVNLSFADMDGGMMHDNSSERGHMGRSHMEDHSKEMHHDMNDGKIDHKEMHRESTGHKEMHHENTDHDGHNTRGSKQ